MANQLLSLPGAKQRVKWLAGVARKGNLSFCWWSGGRGKENGVLSLMEEVFLN